MLAEVRFKYSVYNRGSVGNYMREKHLRSQNVNFQSFTLCQRDCFCLSDFSDVAMNQFKSRDSSLMRCELNSACLSVK